MPKSLLDRLDDLDALSSEPTTHEVKLKWVERQLERAQLRATLDARDKGKRGSMRCPPPGSRRQPACRGS